MAKIARELTVVSLSRDNKSAKQVKTSFLLRPGLPGLFFSLLPFAGGQRGRISEAVFGADF